MRNDPQRPPAQAPFQPEIPRSHFAQGMAVTESYAGDLRLGRFSEGEEALPDSPEREHRGRFSQGLEQLGDADPQKHIRRRYSEGLEHRTARR
jgi:hypothetical protein